MICLQDCIAMCGLTEEEVLAIAEHEHMPEIAAAALAQYLLKREHGAEKIRQMIIDDIRSAQARCDRGRVQSLLRSAQARCDRGRVQSLLHVLHHFLQAHPEARPNNRNRSAS